MALTDYYALPEATIPTGICPRCHRPWDDHDGIGKGKPICPIKGADGRIIR